MITDYNFKYGQNNLKTTAIGDLPNNCMIWEEISSEMKVKENVLNELVELDFQVESSYKAGFKATNLLMIA